MKLARNEFSTVAAVESDDDLFCTVNCTGFAGGDLV
jgi:hypothetical protein